MKDSTFVVTCLALLVGLGLGGLLRKPTEIGRFVPTEKLLVALDTKTGQLCRTVSTVSDSGIQIPTCSDLR